MIVQSVPENTDPNHTNPDIRERKFNKKSLKLKIIDSISGETNQKGWGFWTPEDEVNPLILIYGSCNSRHSVPAGDDSQMESIGIQIGHMTPGSNTKAIWG